ncbi:allantoin permease [Armillaria novae-zelandiae]|uniref:Allantoin permease n=1 Tax=Armillaria novae-zelandiae TaxID=153914 RepID=A0AA39P7U5_9AGAR|nr:allantoin permease [Armillaria novae-zelandiae]
MDIDEKDGSSVDVRIQTVTARPSFRHAFRSWSTFNRYIKTDAGRNIPGNGHIWENEDLLPSPEEQQTWGTGSFFAFWFSESMNTSTWAVASSMITLGMTWWHAILVVLSANMLSSVILVLNGYASSGWHIGYPVLVRTSFGVVGSFFAVIIRSMLGIVWFGIQCTFGGYFVSICLRCIWPSWYTMENHIPESVGITSRDLAGFGIFWIISVGFLVIPTYKTKWLFIAKSFLLPPTGLGLLIWALKKNHGFTGMSFGATQSRGSTLAWAVIAQFNAVMGTNSALLVTVPDITRYARRRSAQTQGQLFSLPIGQTLWATCGIMVTGAMNRQWDTAYWNPYDLLNAMLDHDMSSPTRAGCFFASAAFILATLGTSMANNTIPFGADITALLPRYLTIVRGQLLCAWIGFLIFPWRILSSAPGFLTLLNGYSIFMGPVAGIMIVDYFLVRKGNLQLPGLFTGTRDGPYYYTWGINWRAIIAFLAGTGVPFPGFIQSFGSVAIGEVAEDMFDFGWLASFGIGAMVYWVLCRVFPVGNVDRCLVFEAELERVEREEVERRIKEEYPDGVPYIY